VIADPKSLFGEEVIQIHRLTRNDGANTGEEIAVWVTDPQEEGDDGFRVYVTWSCHGGDLLYFNRLDDGSTRHHGAYVAMRLADEYWPGYETENVLFWTALPVTPTEKGYVTRAQAMNMVRAGWRYLKQSKPAEVAILARLEDTFVALARTEACQYDNDVRISGATIDGRDDRLNVNVVFNRPDGSTIGLHCWVTPSFSGAEVRVLGSGKGDAVNRVGVATRAHMLEMVPPPALEKILSGEEG